jgi:hypothetical protein
MKLFFLVLARDEKHVKDKIREIASLKLPYIVICGKPLNHPNVIYRKPIGKYDAINFGARLVPSDIDVVVLHDVDTKIHNFQAALPYIKNEKVALVFANVEVTEGPQKLFRLFLNALRRRILIAADGELVFIKHSILKKILPLKPCKAEDTYVLFRILEHGYQAVFCEECYIETEKTKSAEKEQIFKRIQVTGIYQALSYIKAPLGIKLFYVLLPFVSPLLLIVGKKGYYWMKGILLGFLDYMRGDRVGHWEPTYME